MGNMMLLEFQRIIERALALHAAIKACYFRKDKPEFCFNKNGYVRKKDIRISNDENTNDLICQKEKQILSSFMELNSKKTR